MRAVAFLLISITSAAWSHASEIEAVQQQLGVSRVSMQSMRLDSPEAIPIVLDGQRVTLKLERSNQRAPGFRVLIDIGGSAQEVQPPEAFTYRGMVPEIPGSVVGGTIRDGSMRAAVALGDGRVFFVQPLREIEPGADADRHVIYDAADIVGGEGFCAANELPVTVPPGLQAGRSSAAGLITAELAFDTDFEYFTKNSGNYSKTVDDIQNIMSLVNAIYERDCGITHHLTLVLVRTTADDPYVSADASGLLNEFRNHWNSTQAWVPRDVAHMMTGRELDGTTIGIAFLGSVCNRSRAYGLSQSHFTTNMGYRITLTAHELGHSWNANHCDAAIPCYIMCSNVGSCDGAGLPGFEPMAIDAITSFAASRSCFGAPVAVEEYAPDGSVRFAPPTPSPFTGETRLGFYLERDQWVALDVYDVRGNRVARLVEGRQPAGWHQVAWRGRDQSGHPVRAGVYFTRLEMVGSMVSHKLILLH